MQAAQPLTASIRLPCHLSAVPRLCPVSCRAFRRQNNPDCQSVCPAGTFAEGKIGAGTDKCDGPCPAGRFSTTGAAVCTSCREGQFQSRHGQDTCALCPIGKFSQYSYTGSVKCTACPPGTGSVTRGATQCTALAPTPSPTPGARIWAATPAPTRPRQCQSVQVGGRKTSRRSAGCMGKYSPCFGDTCPIAGHGGLPVYHCDSCHCGGFGRTYLFYDAKGKRWVVGGGIGSGDDALLELLDQDSQSDGDVPISGSGWKVDRQSS
jgi:hypothetical protein